MKAAAAQAGGQGHTSLRTAALRAFDFSSNPQPISKYWHERVRQIRLVPRSLNGSPLHMLCHHLIMACIENGCLLQGCSPSSSTFAIIISPLKGWCLWGNRSHPETSYHNLFSHFDLEQVGTIDVNDALYTGQSLLRNNLPWCCRSAKHWCLETKDRRLMKRECFSAVLGHGKVCGQLVELWLMRFRYARDGSQGWIFSRIFGFKSSSLGSWVVCSLHYLIKYFL